MTTLINYNESSFIPELHINDSFKGVIFENGWEYTGEYFREDGFTWFIVKKQNVTRAINVSPTYIQRG